MPGRFQHPPPSSNEAAAPIVSPPPTNRQPKPDERTQETTNAFSNASSPNQNQDRQQPQQETPPTSHADELRRQREREELQRRQREEQARRKREKQRQQEERERLKKQEQEKEKDADAKKAVAEESGDEAVPPALQALPAPKRKAPPGYTQTELSGAAKRRRTKPKSKMTKAQLDAELLRQENLDAEEDWLNQKMLIPAKHTKSMKAYVPLFTVVPCSHPSVAVAWCNDGKMKQEAIEERDKQRELYRKNKRRDPPVVIRRKCVPKDCAVSPSYQHWTKPWCAYFQPRGLFIDKLLRHSYVALQMQTRRTLIDNEPSKGQIKLLTETVQPLRVGFAKANGGMPKRMRIAFSDPERAAYCLQLLLDFCGKRHTTMKIYRKWALSKLHLKHFANTKFFFCIVILWYAGSTNLASKKFRNLNCFKRNGDHTYFDKCEEMLDFIIEHFSVMDEGTLFKFEVTKDELLKYNFNGAYNQHVNDWGNFGCWSTEGLNQIMTYKTLNEQPRKYDPDQCKGIFFPFLVLLDAVAPGFIKTKRPVDNSFFITNTEKMLMDNNPTLDDGHFVQEEEEGGDD